MWIVPAQVRNGLADGRREDFQALAHRRRLAGQVDNQGPSARARQRAREDVFAKRAINLQVERASAVELQHNGPIET